VNKVKNLLVPQDAGNFGPAEQILPSQDKFSSMESDSQLPLNVIHRTACYLALTPVCFSCR
jgi:hypothetical protein